MERSVTRVKECFDLVSRYESSFLVLKNIIKHFMDNHRYSAALELLHQLKVRPDTETEFKIGLCHYYLRNWRECIETMQSWMGSDQKRDNTWLCACSCRLLSESFATLGKTE